MDHASRIAKLQRNIGAHDVDAFLVTNLTNVRYLTGFSGSNGQVLVTGADAWFYSDGRYAARAKSLVQGAEIQIYETRVSEVLEARLGGDVTTLGVEGATMTLSERDDLAARHPGVELKTLSGVVEDMRRTKDADEVALLSEAARIADEAYTWILDRLAPGMTERQVALDLEVRMRQTGADEISFDPIVGSGPLSAHIHHTPSDRPFEKGDFVLMDFGARKDGYCSDMTRTVVLGPANEEQEKIYELVLRSHLAGIAAVAPGAIGKEVDAAARKVIDDGGQGHTFAHGLGHGVGIDIHEAPRFAKTSNDVLRVGDIVTVEPGVYIGDWGGVRIEDCVLVTEDGRKVLGGSPKDSLISV
jgi:Xaa-Pro aminopeptidase